MMCGGLLEEAECLFLRINVAEFNWLGVVVDQEDMKGASRDSDKKA